MMRKQSKTIIKETAFKV